MTLNSALENLRGQPYGQILESLRQQTEQVVGKIQGGQLKLLQSFVGATGLRSRLMNATPEQADAATAIAEAIQPAYLAADNYSINLADPQVAGLLTGAVVAGLLSPAESAYLTGLATYQRPLWPNLTLRDVVAYFEPALVDVGQWTVLVPGDKRQLMLQVVAPAPELTSVRIEMCESHNGQNWTEWRRIAPFVGVMAVGVYYQSIPWQGLQRQIRWRGEQYLINATVEAV